MTTLAFQNQPKQAVPAHPSRGMLEEGQQQLAES